MTNINNQLLKKNTKYINKLKDQMNIILIIIYFVVLQNGRVEIKFQTYLWMRDFMSDG